MEITRATEYAIRGVLDLCSQPLGSVSLLSEISERQEIPLSFLSKILQKLAKDGIVSSSRGAGGGFAIGKDPREITLLEVLEAVEGHIALNVCLNNGKACRNQPTCAVHLVWREAQEQMVNLLRKRSFAELAETNRRLAEEAAREPQPSD